MKKRSYARRISGCDEFQFLIKTQRIQRRKHKQRQRFGKEEEDLTNSRTAEEHTRKLELLSKLSSNQQRGQHLQNQNKDAHVKSETAPGR